MSQLADDVPVTLGPAESVSDDLVEPFYVADRKQRISVARVDGRLYAFDDLCTCAEPPCPLSGGLLAAPSIMCQCHGSRFDVTTGAVIEGPATTPLTVYDVQVLDGQIQIRV